MCAIHKKMQDMQDMLQQLSGLICCAKVRIYIAGNFRGRKIPELLTGVTAKRYHPPPQFRGENMNSYKTLKSYKIFSLEIFLLYMVSHASRKCCHWPYS